MSADFQSPVTAYLQEKGIPYRIFRHLGPINSLEQAARERNQSLEQVVRSILFKLGHGKYALALIAGNRQISWVKLRKHLGQSRLTLASEADVLAVTGYPLGAVSPLGVAHPLRLLVDESVFSQDEISLGSGVRGTAVILRVEDLAQALGVFERGSFAVEETV